ncbi:hypothetical protein T190611E02C_11397 [Tenacibaculum sp. 190524A05c]
MHFGVLGVLHFFIKCINIMISIILIIIHRPAFVSARQSATTAGFLVFLILKSNYIYSYTINIYITLRYTL